MSEQSRAVHRLLINPKFQLKLLSYFFGLFIISTASYYSTTYLFFWRMKSKGLAVGIPEGHVYYEFLQNQKHDLDVFFIGLIAFNFLLLTAVGFLISHRIAGPIQKIKSFLETGSPDELKFRKKDFFQDLVSVAKNAREKMK